MYTDVRRGLPAGQPRGILIANPPLRAGGCALILYKFEVKCRAEYYRSMRKYGFCTYVRSLTNQINAAIHGRMSDSLGYTWPSWVGDDLHAERVGGSRVRATGPRCDTD